MTPVAPPAAPQPIDDESETRRVARSLWLRSLLGDVSSRPEVDALAARMREVLFPRGTYLYRRGTASEQIAFIVSGTIIQGDEGHTRFATGDVLGFVDGSIGRPHALDARVESDAVVLLLAVEDWFEFLEDHFDFMRSALFRRTHELPPLTFGYDSLPPRDEVDPPTKSDDERDGIARLVDRLAALNRCPLLERASVQSIAQLGRHAEVYGFDPGTTFDVPEEMTGVWIGLGGCLDVRLEMSTGTYEFTAGRSTLLGGLTVLQQLPGPFRLKTERGARALYVPTERFFDVMEDHFDLTRSILAFVASQVEQANRTGPNSPGRLVSSDGALESEGTRREQTHGVMGDQLAADPGRHTEWPDSGNEAATVAKNG